MKIIYLGKQKYSFSDEFFRTYYLNYQTFKVFPFPGRREVSRWNRGLGLQNMYADFFPGNLLMEKIQTKLLLVSAFFLDKVQNILL